MLRQLTNALLVCVAGGALACSTLAPVDQVASDRTSGMTFLGRSVGDDPATYLYAWLPYLGSLALGIGLLARRRTRGRRKVLIGAMLGQVALHGGVLWWTGELAKGAVSTWYWDPLYHLTLNVMGAVCYVAIATVSWKSTRTRLVRPTQRPAMPAPTPQTNGARKTQGAGIF